MRGMKYNVLDHQTRHMHHEMHLWDDTFIKVQLAELLVMITDEGLQVGSIIFLQHWTEKQISNLHHLEKI